MKLRLFHHLQVDKSNDMHQEKNHKTRHFFIEGAISPTDIAESIAKHSSKKDIGAHDIFLGQVRADIINGQQVKAIDYSAYTEMAEQELARIREEIIVSHKLSCAHILHSLGLVKTGEICLFVFVSSGHRKAAFDACREMVERIKKEVPIFGKEVFEDGTHVWKENTE
jgi:molybdopterin synthase catalytic subunit